MAFILNQYDVEEAQIKAAHDLHRPNLRKAVLTLARLVEWTNSNSDGWPYWSKPSTAATKLQVAIQLFYFTSYEKTRYDDLTKVELKALETPIKSFLTRQGVAHSEVFIND